MLPNDLEVFLLRSYAAVRRKDPTKARLVVRNVGEVSGFVDQDSISSLLFTENISVADGFMQVEHPHKNVFAFTLEHVYRRDLNGSLTAGVGSQVRILKSLDRLEDGKDEAVSSFTVAAYLKNQFDPREHSLGFQKELLANTENLKLYAEAEKLSKPSTMKSCSKFWFNLVPSKIGKVIALWEKHPNSNPFMISGAQGPFSIELFLANGVRSVQLYFANLRRKYELTNAIFSKLTQTAIDLLGIMEDVYTSLEFVFLRPLLSQTNVKLREYATAMVDYLERIRVLKHNATKPDFLDEFSTLRTHNWSEWLCFLAICNLQFFKTRLPGWLRPEPGSAEYAALFKQISWTDIANPAARTFLNQLADIKYKDLLVELSAGVNNPEFWLRDILSTDSGGRNVGVLVPKRSVVCGPYLLTTTSDASLKIMCVGGEAQADSTCEVWLQDYDPILKRVERAAV